MMHDMLALLLPLATVGVGQQAGAAGEDPGASYGYIALGAIILVVAIVVLIRRQHRKFNE